MANSAGPLARTISGASNCDRMGPCGCPLGGEICLVQYLGRLWGGFRLGGEVMPAALIAARSAIAQVRYQPKYLLEVGLARPAY